MKKTIITLLLLVPVLVYGQTQTENYVKTTAYQVPATLANQQTVSDSDKIEGVTYYDGLGRPKQNVAQRAGADGEDQVTPIEYDGFGRQPKDYLPLPVDGLGGGFYEGTGGTQVTDELKTYYKAKFPNDFYQGNDPLYTPDWDNPYSEKLFEDSPRSRVQEQGAPGYDWHVSFAGDNTVKFTHDLNQGDNVHNFQVAFAGGDTSQPSLTLTNTYANRTLTKTVTKDENWQPADGNDRTIQEYKNKKGQMVLKRTFKSGTKHDTYYIYDDFGNLTFVLSPEASAQIVDGNGNLVTQTQTVLDELGYQYRYDHRNRLVEKKIPGKGWEYILYDTLDRPVLTQDANLRSNGEQWLFTKYDVFGRVAYTGIYTPPLGFGKSQIENTLESPQYYNEERTTGATTVGDTDMHYTNQVFPTVNLEVLTINYYDDYAMDHSPTVLPTSVLGQTVSSTVKGLPTVSQVRTLDTGEWTTALTAYDDKGRVVYADSYNDYLNARDIAKSLLDFTGKPLETETQHIKDSNGTIVIKDYYTYDPVGRLLTHKQQIEDEELQLIAHNTYDELGQLVAKGVGGTALLDGYTDLKHVTVSSNGTITATTPLYFWRSRAKTLGAIPSTFDGGVEAIVAQDDAFVRMGLLEPANANQTQGYYDYGLELTDDGKVKLVLQNTASLPLSGRQYQAGDLFRVYRDGDYLRFYHNNDEITTNGLPILLSQAQKDAALIGKASFSGPGLGSVSNLHLFGPLLDTKLQTVNYKYNVRGWLTDINDVDATAPSGLLGLETYSDLFNFRINYNTVEGDYLPDNPEIVPLYNGNIAETVWRTNNTDQLKRSYGYRYDDLNRLLKGVMRHGEQLDVLNGLTKTQKVWNLEYDRNGNIQRLKRGGYSILEMYDDLHYTYETVNGITTNQLASVTDSADGSASNKAKAFYDGNTSGDDYDYDANGNLTLDHNKGITSITYNHLNLPVTVSVNNGSQIGTITYVYDATGTKLKKTLAEGTSPPVHTEYAGGYVYANLEAGSALELQFIPHPEGYIMHTPPALPDGDGDTKSIKQFASGTGQITDTEYAYVFQYTDHLGNVRLSYSDSDGNGSVDSSEIIEENNYMPFGLKHWGYNTNVSTNGNSLAQQRKFNGKELNPELGLDLYHYGARFYDPALGLFTTIDPKAQSFYFQSPYVYAANNPIAFHEKNGENPVLGILKALAKKGVKWAAKNSKGQIKPVSTKQAKNLLKKKKTVYKTDPKTSNKKAKRLAEKSDKKKVVRHDGHKLKKGKKGMDHYQPKSGDGSHVNVYKGGSIVLATNSNSNTESGTLDQNSNTESNESNNGSTSNENNSSLSNLTTKQKVMLRATMNPSNSGNIIVGNAGKLIFGDNKVGNFIDDWLNPAMDIPAFDSNQLPNSNEE